MSVFSTFSDDEVLLLISLPYKVGVYISHADDAEGELDDEKELRALSGCIRAVAKQYDGPGLVDDIARATLEAHDKWEGWAEASYNILPDCTAAIALLFAKGTRGDAKNYRAALMTIASTVAQAYGEFVSFDDFPEEEGFFSGIASKIAGHLSKLSPDDAGHPSNISAAEDSAMARLSGALKLPE